MGQHLRRGAETGFGVLWECETTLSLEMSMAGVLSGVFNAGYEFVSLGLAETRGGQCHATTPCCTSRLPPGLYGIHSLQSTFPKELILSVMWPSKAD